MRRGPERSTAAETNRTLIPMKIAIPAHFIKAGRVGGAEQALYNLVEGFSACGADVVVPVSRKTNLSGEFLERFSTNDRVRITELGFFQSRFLAEQLAVCLHRENVDLTLFTNYYTPFYMPAACGKVFTVINDFRYLNYPEFTSWKKRTWLNFSLRRTFGRADRILAISKQTRDDAIKFFGARAEGKVSVVHIAVSWARLRGEDEDHPLDGAPYILSVAHNWAHKNLATLLQAYHELRTGGGTAKLVLVGETFATYRPTHERSMADLGGLARSLGMEDDIVFTGYISDRELSRYYRHATVFAFPSLFEGFGLPIVEALGFGVPTVTARQEPHLEVSRGKAIYVDQPLDPDSWRDILSEILDDPESFRPAPQVVREIREAYAPERIARQIMSLME